MASLGYFTTMPRPDPRKLPELPPVTPWVPVVPKMPDLPEEIPWPPDFTWPDWSPWYTDPTRPSCYDDFARRMMAMMANVATLRAANGQRPMYPPFDLRFSPANPMLVSIATLWLKVMWNTMLVAAGEAYDWDFLPGSSSDGAYYRESPAYTYQNGGGRTGTASGYWYNTYVRFSDSTGHGADWQGKVISDAYLIFNAAEFTSSGASVKIDCHNTASPVVPSSAADMLTAWGARTGHTTTMTEESNPPYHQVSPSIKDSAQAVVDLVGFNGLIGVMLTDFLHESSGYFSFNYYKSILQYTRLRLVVGPSLEPVAPITHLTLERLDCSVMMSWLIRTEAVIWPVLRR